jgi:hypothetical protein
MGKVNRSTLASSLQTSGFLLIINGSKFPYLVGLVDLVCLVCSVDLVCLVCLVDLVDLVRLVYLVCLVELVPLFRRVSFDGGGAFVKLAKNETDGKDEIEGTN